MKSLSFACLFAYTLMLKGKDLQQGCLRIPEKFSDKQAKFSEHVSPPANF